MLLLIDSPRLVCCPASVSSEHRGGDDRGEDGDQRGGCRSRGTRERRPSGGAGRGGPMAGGRARAGPGGVPARPAAGRPGSAGQPASAGWRRCRPRPRACRLAARLRAAAAPRRAKPGLEGSRELAGGRVAGVGVALERAQDGDARASRARRGRRRWAAAGCSFSRRHRELGEGRALPRQPAGEQLVEADAERVDVGGRRRLLAARLLRGQIGGGADDRADLGEPRLGGSRGRSRSP